jgi:hypothetical protein
MSDVPKRSRKPIPANDNQRPRTMRAIVNLARGLPIQLVEIELFAELLDSLPDAANDNEAEP